MAIREHDQETQLGTTNGCEMRQFVAGVKCAQVGWTMIAVLTDL